MVWGVGQTGVGETRNGRARARAGERGAGFVWAEPWKDQDVQRNRHGRWGEEVGMAKLSMGHGMDWCGR